jgi:Tol biopolymer transport system component
MLYAVLPLALMAPGAHTVAAHSPTCAHHAYLPPLDQDAPPAPAQGPSWVAIAPHPQERHLRNLRQLTFGGQNAEAYWSADGRKIVYQTLQPGFPDEQVFTMDADGRNKTLVSTGKGRCTCSYFSPDGRWIYFSSTHERNEGPQKKADMSKGYVWMVNPDFALYRTGTRTTGNPKPQPILKRNGYIAETTISPDGRYMTFTGNFEGDLEIYRANPDGTNVRRLTNEIGYDGGPFVSWDGKKIVYRRQAEDTPEKIAEYRALLKENLVRPSRLDIWIMDADGGNKRRVTQLPGANFAPFLHPDGKRIIFSSNHEDPKGREFDLYMVNVDGTGLERITYSGDFDGFPMFTRDGRKLVFASNRNGKVRGETNIFVADWVD